MKLLLFDIDSTLLRDGGAAARAFNQAFIEQFAVEPGHVDKFGRTDAEIAGNVAKVTLDRDLTADEFQLLKERYGELYPVLLAQSTGFMLLSGVMELCSSLSDNPMFALGIQTGNFRRQAAIKLERAGLDRFFRFGGYGSDSGERVELVRMAIERGRKTVGMAVNSNDVIVIGDSVHDVKAGKANGAFSIGVTTGANSAEELFAAGADSVVEDLTAESGIYGILDGRSGREDDAD